MDDRIYKNRKIIIVGLIILIVLCLIGFFYFKGYSAYTVSFDAGNGSKPVVVNVKSGNKLKKPKTPTREGYEFVEWQLDGKTYNFDTPIKENMKLTAVWRLASVEEGYFIVTFDTDGGTAIESQKIKSGESAVAPVVPTKEGYEFVEWQLNGKTYDFKTPITDNITLTANWKAEKYTVTFNSNGGSSVNTQTIDNGDKATKPKDPTKSGYIFVEWQLNGKVYNFNTPVTESIVLVASWKANDGTQNIEKYTIKFDSNGGSSVNSQTIDSGSTATKPANPTRSGYTFVEWQLNGKTYDFKTPVTKNITLVAKWKQDVVQTYTVTFDSNGGSIVSSQTVNSGSTVTRPTNPMRNGYTFVEWQLNGSAYNFSTPVTRNITLVAKWSQNTTQTYTVTFDSNGGSSVSAQTVNSGSTVSQPTAPTKPGYTFVEWQLNGSAYNFSTPVTSNITLTAKWNQKTYTIRAVPVDAYSPSRYLYVYENGTKINVYALYYTDGVKLNGFTENVNTLESAYLVQLVSGGEKFRASVVD